MRDAESLGLDTLVEAHDADELERAIALGAPVIGVNARDLSTFVSTARAQLELARARRHDATALVVAESGDRHARPGRRRRARRRERDPGRLGADARSRPRGEAARAALAAAREGLRADARRRTSTLRSRRAPTCSGSSSRRRARARATGCCRRPETVLSVAVFVGEVHETGADLVQLYAREDGQRAPRRSPAARRRAGRDGRRPAVAGRRPPHWRRGRGAEGRVVLAGGLGAGERRARRSRRVHPWAVDAARSSSGAGRSRITTRCAPTWRPPRGRAERFGAYGGRYVPETLIPALDELEAGWRGRAGRRGVPRRAPRAADDLRRPADAADPGRALRPGQARLPEARGSAAHRRAQAQQRARPGLLAQRLGKRRIVAETGAGQHGVAAATVCARFGLECVVYMGDEDMRRQRPTSSGWACSAPRCARSSSGRGR